MELRCPPPAERVPAEGRALTPPLGQQGPEGGVEARPPPKGGRLVGAVAVGGPPGGQELEPGEGPPPHFAVVAPRRLLAPWKRASPPSSRTVAASEARRRRPPEMAARATTSQSPNDSAIPASFSNCAMEAHCRCGAAAVRARCLSIASTTSQSPRRTNGCSSHPTFSKSRTAERSFRQGPEEVSVRAEVRSRCSRTQRISRSGCLSASESKRRSA